MSRKVTAILAAAVSPVVQDLLTAPAESKEERRKRLNRESARRRRAQSKRA